MDDLKDVIIKNQNLIYSIINRFNQRENIEDLFQVGCIGMIEAYKKFDKNRNVKFTTYAYPYILGKISEYVRENHTVKLSKDMNKARNKVFKVKTFLTQELMREPTVVELSEYLNISVDNLNMLLNYTGDALSLDEEYDDTSFYNVFKSPDVDYDSLLYIKKELEDLEEPERTIMFQRYFEDMTQSEVASNLGLSQVNVSRREKKVLVKLRQTN